MGVERAGPPDVEGGTPRENRAQDPEADGGTEGGLVTRAFSAMRDRNFRLLYLGNMLQFGAQQMQLLVRGLIVYQLTGSFALLGSIALASAVPGLLLSPVGGVMADRMTKKTIIQLAQGFNAVNAALLALLAFAASSNYWLTMGIMFVVGIGQTGRMAIGQVLIQTYAADEYRGRVTAVWFMQFSLVQLGTFFVGILAEVFGPQWAIGGLAALMVVTMGFVWVFVPRIRNLE